MGRKAGLYINPKTFGSLQKPCIQEMILFLNCMAQSQKDGSTCTKQKEQLMSCMDFQGNKKRSAMGTLNYQLQRLNRARK
ncbi:hypothetical protein L6164_037159 [Bauhinia variegata]|uniref:Uncharacterized protein n=1 Tax=Bauhinia variegata TaxID=167791 RepID=A0ACB9KJ29_BAUVA|nr:hypothetical protein L6164_037159 [Bauhinia variegata]